MASRERRKSVHDVSYDDRTDYRMPSGDKFTGKMQVQSRGSDLPVSGTMRFQNGAVFKGTFLRGKFHGNGVLRFVNGDVYDGCFIHDGVAGAGKFTDAATKTMFTGKFGTRRKLTDPPISDLEPTNIHRGTASAKNLTPCPITPAPDARLTDAEQEAMEAEDEVEEAEVAPPTDAAESAPTAEEPPPAEGAPAAALALDPTPPAAPPSKPPAPRRQGGPAAAASSKRVPKEDPADLLAPHIFRHASLISGQGEIRYANGRIWTGRFADGHPVTSKNESGTLFIPVKRRAGDDPTELLQDVYAGEVTGLAIPHGKGKMDFCRGGECVGQFYGGKPHGRVAWELADGEGTYTGQVEHGALTGTATLQLPGGDVYRGQFLDGDYMGRGQYEARRERTVFEGYFTRGMRHGRGRLVSSLGNVFDGYWADDCRYGIGVSHTASGERQEAWYIDDHIVRVPRIFFQPLRALPGRITHKVAGASLSAFCEQPGRPTKLVTFSLKVAPAWLTCKRRNPIPPPAPGPLLAAVTVGKGGEEGGASDARVKLQLRHAPRGSARAKCHLEVTMAPPAIHFLSEPASPTATSSRGLPPPPILPTKMAVLDIFPPCGATVPDVGPVPFDVPSMAPRVRLHLYAMDDGVGVGGGGSAPVVDISDGAARGEERNDCACVCSFQVLPLLSWHVPPEAARKEDGPSPARIQVPLSC